MMPIDVRNGFIRQDLSLLGSMYLLGDGRTSECCRSHAELFAISEMPGDSLDREVEAHLKGCIRCAHGQAVFRGVRQSRRWDPQSMVCLQADGLVCGEEGVQLFGHLSLEDGRMHWCLEEDWIRNPLFMRTTVVIDAMADTVGLSIADTPSVFEAAKLETPVGSVAFDRLEELEMLCFSSSLSELTDEADSFKAADRFLSWLHSGVLLLCFHIGSEETPNPTLLLLQDANAIETEFDYELPSGLHCDTHINVGKLCHSEQLLQRAASLFDALFMDTDFDTVVTNGWAMGTIARRLADVRAKRRGRGTIDTVVCDGYPQLQLLADIARGSRVLVLVDVVVTGTLVSRMCDVSRRAGAQVVGIGALVEAHSANLKHEHRLRALCPLPMSIVNPMTDECTHCNSRERRVFNPVSQCMTKRAPYARSPSEFLATNPDAQEFWEYVNRAAAYEHHRREGNVHYSAFIDTRKLLDHPEIGPVLVETLHQRLIDKQNVPQVLLVVDRARAKRLAEMLATTFDASTRPMVVIARRVRRLSKRLNVNFGWEIATEDRDKLAHRAVLVLDTAVAQGVTIDCLAQLAASCHASSVGAAVLISRLAEGCEEAITARFGGRFICLYRLPIGGVVVRGSNPDICPVCRRKRAIAHASQSSGIHALQQWAEHLRHRGRRPHAESDQPSAITVQLDLFGENTGFLEICRGAVASGVTLHALSAAMKNGMASLTLPEIFNSRIPSRTRTAMVENLPQGAVEWSGASLANDLRGFLDSGKSPNVWRASAEALIKDGAHDWLIEVDTLLSRFCGEGRLSSDFWNHMACATHLAVAHNPKLKPIVHDRLNRLAKSNTDTTEGVELILQTMPE